MNSQMNNVIDMTNLERYSIINLISQGPYTFHMNYFDTEDESVEDDEVDEPTWLNVSTKHFKRTHKLLKVQGFQKLSWGEKCRVKKETKKESKYQHSKSKKYQHRKTSYTNKSYYEANFWMQECDEEVKEECALATEEPTKPSVDIDDEYDKLIDKLISDTWDTFEEQKLEENKREMEELQREKEELQREESADVEEEGDEELIYWKNVSVKHESKTHRRRKVQEHQKLSKGEKKIHKKEQKQQLKHQYVLAKKRQDKRVKYTNKGVYEANFWREELVETPEEVVEKKWEQTLEEYLAEAEWLENDIKASIETRERRAQEAIDEMERLAQEEADRFCSINLSHIPVPGTKKHFVDLNEEQSTKRFLTKFKNLVQTTREEEPVKLKDKKQKKMARQFMKQELSKQYQEKKCKKTLRIKRERQGKLRQYASVHFGNDVDMYFEYYDESLPKYIYIDDDDSDDGWYCYGGIDWSRSRRYSRVDEHTAFKTSEEELNGWKWNAW